MAGSRINQNNNAAASNSIPVQWFSYVAVPEPAAGGVCYRECRRNHAASIGRYTFDGCGEFLKAGKDGTKGAFICAACGCHRSFHRKELQLHGKSETISGKKTVVEIIKKNKGKTKRTKITEEQKCKMRGFAEKLGWKPQRHDEEDVEKFCGEVGISRKIFKAWLSNNRRRTAVEKCCDGIAEKNLQAVEENN